MGPDRRPTLLPVLALAIAGAALAACSDADSQRAPPQSVEVSVLAVKAQRAELSTELPGRTTAYRIAQVRPQVSGIIKRRLFTEGAYVAEGQALYQIDPAPYQVALESAEAAVAKAQANLNTARLRYDRVQKLAETGVVSQQDRDDTTAARAQFEADLATARAQQRTASINLGYTRISSPIAGRTSTSTVTEGALVTTNQIQTLTTVQQLNPIYVDLTQSSAELLRLRARLAAGDLQRSGVGKARVKIKLEDNTVYAHEGVLEFTGVTVSETTGAITLRAVVPNADGQLLPGMYVRALVDQGVDEQALLVPQSVVSRNDRGDPVVLVVNAQNIVEQRVLATPNAVGNDWLVTDGLAIGDRVIVTGLQKIKIGDTVRVAAAD